MGDTIGQSCHSNDSDFFDTLRNCLRFDPNGINEFFKDFNLPIGHQPTKGTIHLKRRHYLGVGGWG